VELAGVVLRLRDSSHERQHAPLDAVHVTHYLSPQVIAFAQLA
jgi:hypothetical protein